MPESIFLTESEVTQLTGVKSPGWQRRWLSRNGYRFEQASNGRPVVLRSTVEAKAGPGGAPTARTLNMAGIRG